MTSTERPPVAAIAALGLTQIIGYGSLYYSFSILAPDMARDLGWSSEWIFGALSAALRSAVLPHLSSARGSIASAQAGS